MNYCKENGYRRLEQLSVSNLSDWYDFKLIYIESFPNKKYWETLPSKYIKSFDIPLEKIIGTSHIDYSNKSWIENLGCLKRFSLHYTKEHWEPYFKSKKTKPDIHYIKYGNHFFIGSDGNHRTHIARFLGFKYIRATVTEYFFDYELFNIIQEYMDEKLLLKLDGNNLYRDATWLLKINEISFFIHGMEMLKKFIFFYKKNSPSSYIFRKMTLLRRLGFISDIKFVHLHNDESFKGEIFKNLSGIKYEKIFKQKKTKSSTSTPS